LNAATSESLEIEVIDIYKSHVLRSIIHPTETNEKTIDLSGSKPGLYFLLIKSDDFNIVKKIVLN
jgi:hypothetical protein